MYFLNEEDYLNEIFKTRIRRMRRTWRIQRIRILIRI